MKTETDNMNNFVIREYGKSELAMLYFQKAQTAKGALSNLNSWINQNRKLKAALRDCGMSPAAKSYTPKEVALIIEHIGEPMRIIEV